MISEPILFAKYVFLIYKLEVLGENCSKNCQKLQDLVVFPQPAILCSIWGAAPQQLLVVFLSQPRSYLLSSSRPNHMPLISKVTFQIVWNDESFFLMETQRRSQFTHPLQAFSSEFTTMFWFAA